MPGYIVPRLVLEGNYTTWTKQWQREGKDDSYPAPAPNQIYPDETNDKILFFDGYDYTMQVFKLSDGTLLEESPILQNDYHSFIKPSILNKYNAIVKDIGGEPNLVIYKDGGVVQTINLKTVCGWTSVSVYYVATFSPDGKYLYVGYSAYPFNMALFKGS